MINVQSSTSSSFAVKKPEQADLLFELRHAPARALLDLHVENVLQVGENLLLGMGVELDDGIIIDLYVIIRIGPGQHQAVDEIGAFIAVHHAPKIDSEQVHGVPEDIQEQLQRFLVEISPGIQNPLIYQAHFLMTNCSSLSAAQMVTTGLWFDSLSLFRCISFLHRVGCPSTVLRPDILRRKMHDFFKWLI